MNFNNTNKSEIFWKNIFNQFDCFSGFAELKNEFSNKTNEIELDISESLTDEINKLVNSSPETSNIFFISILGILIKLYNDTSKVCIGTPAAESNGDIKNLIPVYLEFGSIDLTFKELLTNTTKSYLSSIEHQNYSIEQIDKDNFDLKGNSLFFDSVCLINTIHNREDIIPYIRDKKIFLIFDFFIDRDSIKLKVTYNESYITKDKLQFLLKQFEQAISLCMSNYDVKISNLNLVSKEEKKIILEQFNNTQYDYPLTQSLNEILEQSFNKYANNKAVEYNGSILSFSQLEKLSGKIGNYLINELKIKPETAVGILMERSEELIPSIYGIIRSGGAYVPLDPTFPENRLKAIINDAEISVVLTTKKHIKLINKLQWECTKLKTFMCLDSENVYSEIEQDNRLMEKSLWNHIGKQATNEIIGGGWQSSYTGKPFSEKEMDEYANNVLSKLKPFLNDEVKILEIGCSSGITMYTIAPHVKNYYGIDLSEELIKSNKKKIEKEKIDNIHLYCLEAHSLEKINENDFDIIIINSVVHCFSGHNYFRSVLEKSINLLKENGHIFLGDIMDVDLKKQLIEDTLNFKKKNLNKNYLTKTDWDNELFISKKNFYDLQCHFPEIAEYSCSDKIHNIENELTKYRYDVLVTINKDVSKGTTEPKKNQHDKRTLNKFKSENCNLKVPYDNLAYIIYTSGTTGTPKGVMIQHNSLINRLYWMQREYNINEKDVLLLKTSFTFDVSVWEIFWWAFFGAKLEVLPPEKEKDPISIIQIINEKKVTIIHFVPSMLEAFLNYVLDNHVDIYQLSSLKQVIVSGEALTINQVDKFKQVFGELDIRLANLYGPTEATIDVSYCNINLEKEHTIIPIGKPIDNIKLFIVGKESRLQPIGIPGELCISGIGVSRGYINNEALTAEKFVPNPFEESGIMYKTGDSARWLPDGNIEFLGRIDQQVKIRGFRIELEEINTYILQYPGIKQCVTIVQQDEQNYNNLCTYYLADNDIDIDELKNHLQKHLSEYMIPAFLMQLDQIPIGINGKLDRKKLPHPELIPKNIIYPKSDEEKQMVSIMAEVLKKETNIIDINTSFFSYGGHSLSAIALASNINKQFSVNITIEDIFQFQTVKGLINRIKELDKQSYNKISKVSSDKDFYPLSPSQKRIYVVQQYNLNSTAYNIPQILEIEGELNVSLVNDIFTKLIYRHEALRTFFELEGSEAVQKISTDIEFKLEEIKFDGDISSTISNFIKPFDLSIAPLLRAGMIKKTNSKVVIVIDKHHIISDGLSEEIFLRDFVKIYNNEVLDPLEIQYTDYTEWIYNLKEDGNLNKQKEFWLDQFKEDLPILDLPNDFSRPVIQEFEGQNQFVELSEDVEKQLIEMAEKNDVSLYVLIMSIFNIFLVKLSQNSDIIVGTPVSGRKHDQLKDLMGVFINTLCIRNKIDFDESFTKFIQRVKTAVVKAMDNQEYPFEELVNDLDIKRDLSHNPIFDVMLVHNNISYLEDPLYQLPGIKILSKGIKNNSSKVDLTLYVNEDDGKFKLEFEYSTSLFKKDTIERFVTYFKKIVSTIIVDQTIKISEIEILTDEEKQQHLYKFNDTKTDYPKDKTIIDLFEEQVEKTPDDVALLSEGEKHTYKELNEKSNQLARVIWQKGIKKEDVIGIMMSRCPEMIISIIGVLKTACVYTPIDPEYPVGRIKYMIEDSGLNLLLTEQALNHIYSQFNSNVESIDVVSSGFYTGNKENPGYELSPSNLAYLIYTSGSTGKPKGIMIEHKNVINFIQGVTEKIYFGKSSSILCLTTVSFDIFVLETILPLLRGLKIILANSTVQKDINVLATVLREQKVDLLQITPSFLKLFLDSSNQDIFQGIKVIMIGGEALPSNLLVELRSIYNGKIYNMYGPTETTVWSTIQDLTTTQSINIGKPICNTFIYIIDNNKNLQPIGVSGELCIGGEGLARGYWNNEQLTSEKFISNPYSQGERIYRTGDLARWLPDGNIEFLGRIDNQVKIRGFRIELEEIESQLALHNMIKESLVLAKEKENDKYLVAYYISEKEIEIAELRSHISSNLPDYMIPSYFVWLKSIPLTPNGKIDRNALPEPIINKKKEFVAPSDELENKIAAICSEALNLGDHIVSMNDNFIELGGNSLVAMIIADKVIVEFEITIPFKDLLSFTTINQMSEYVKNELWIKEERQIDKNKPRKRLSI